MKIYLGGKWKKRRSSSGTCKILNHSLHFDSICYFVVCFCWSCWRMYVQRRGFIFIHLVVQFHVIWKSSTNGIAAFIELIMPCHQVDHWIAPLLKRSNKFLHIRFIHKIILFWFLVRSSFTVLYIRKYCFYISGTTWYGTIWNFAFYTRVELYFLTHCFVLYHDRTMYDPFAFIGIVAAPISEFESVRLNWCVRM